MGQASYGEFLKYGWHLSGCSGGSQGPGGLIKGRLSGGGGGKSIAVEWFQRADPSRTFEIICSSGLRSDRKLHGGQTNYNECSDSFS